MRIRKRNIRKYNFFVTSATNAQVIMITIKIKGGKILVEAQELDALLS